MIKDRIWITVGAGLFASALLVLGALWIFSPGKVSESEGGIPQMTEVELQEFATAKWWSDMDSQEQIETCIIIAISGKSEVYDAANQVGLDAKTMWTFLSRKCGL